MQEWVARPPTDNPIRVSILLLLVVCVDGGLDDALCVLLDVVEEIERSFQVRFELHSLLARSIERLSR